MDLGPAVSEAGHVLRACLRPPNRPTGLLRKVGQEEFLGVDADLRTEPAANVGGDDPDGAFGEAVDALQRVSGALWGLRGAPLDEPVLVPDRSRRTTFERSGGHAVVHDALADDDLAPVEQFRITSEL